MNKRQIHKNWVIGKKLRPWFFLVIAIVFGSISLFSLRANNQQMVLLREAVYVADKKGDPVELNKALFKLHEYVVNHMNTSLTSGPNAVHPPIQLRYSYERAQAEQQQQLGQNNAAIYHDAQQKCQAEHPGNDGAATIACIENYTAERGIRLGNIPDAAYKIDYISAAWSPDLAGWSLVVTVLSSVGFVLISVHRAWKKRNI